MYRPSLKSDRSLIILLILAIVLFYIAQSSYLHIKSDNYELKIAAANLMKASIITSNLLKKTHSTTMFGLI